MIDYIVGGASGVLGRVQVMNAQDPENVIAVAQALDIVEDEKDVYWTAVDAVLNGENPVHRHDCCWCVWVGTMSVAEQRATFGYAGSDWNGVDQPLDFYVHPGSGKHGDLKWSPLARYGEDGDYSSASWPEAIRSPLLLAAWRAAKAVGMPGGMTIEKTGWMI